MKILLIISSFLFSNLAYSKTCTDFTGAYYNDNGKEQTCTFIEQDFCNTIEVQVVAADGSEFGEIFKLDNILKPNKSFPNMQSSWGFKNKSTLQSKTVFKSGTVATSTFKRVKAEGHTRRNMVRKIKTKHKNGDTIKSKMYYEIMGVDYCLEKLEGTEDDH